MCEMCTTSPVPGPAEVLFQKPYYESIKAALKPKGILCSQGRTSTSVCTVGPLLVCVQ